MKAESADPESVVETIVSSWNLDSCVCYSFGRGSADRP